MVGFKYSNYPVKERGIATFVKFRMGGIGKESILQKSAYYLWVRPERVSYLILNRESVKVVRQTMECTSVKGLVPSIFVISPPHKNVKGKGNGEVCNL